MHLAILTGGGDVPGLNALLVALTDTLTRQGHRLTGIRRGWLGLVAIEPTEPRSVAEHTEPLTPARLRNFTWIGGTTLHSSRTNPGRMPAAEGAAKNHAPSDATSTVLAHLEQLGVDGLIVVGGDDTLGYGERLSRAGVPVLGIPKTMDNDVGGTEVCLGFATCVARTVAYLEQLKTPAASHERIAVVEVMGRHSGASCLWPALLAGADRALIAEVLFAWPRVAELLRADRAAKPEGYALLVVSEGARPEDGEVLMSGPADAYGHRKLGGIGAVVASELTARTGVACLSQRLGYLVRAGAPDAHDVLLAHGFAAMAAELIERNQFGRLVGVRRGVYGHEPLAAVTRAVPLEVNRLYDADQLRPRLAQVAGCGLWPVAAS